MNDRRCSMIAALALAVALAPLPSLAAGGTPSTPAPESKSPEQEAVEAYNAGLSGRDRAWKLEEKAAGETDEDRRAKLETKVRKAYESAIRDFSRAVEKNPVMFQAWSSLGYAYRKTGRFDDSLVAYDRALSLNPAYAEAIEYRGEAYLGLNRVEDAKQAYVELFGIDRELAGQLLDAMERWVEAGRAGGGGAELDAFAAWIADRRKIASQTADAGARGATRDGW